MTDPAIDPEAYVFTNRGDDPADPWFDITPLDTDFYGYLQVVFRAYDVDPGNHSGTAPFAETTAIFEVRGEPPPEEIIEFLRQARLDSSGSEPG